MVKRTFRRRPPIKREQEDGGHGAVKGVTHRSAKIPMNQPNPQSHPLSGFDNNQQSGWRLFYWDQKYAHC